MTHNNGVGQGWLDCTPFGTHNLEQALKACKASVGASCTVGSGCGASNEIVRGDYTNGTMNLWGYGTNNAGGVGPSCAVSGGGWN